MSAFCLYSGFFCKFDDSTYNWSKLQEHCDLTDVHVDECFSTIYTLRRPVNIELQLPNNLNTSSLFFLARQPKSRHVALWPWKILKESNANLLEYSKDKEGLREFVLSEGGVYEGLCKKVIYLW